MLAGKHCSNPFPDRGLQSLIQESQEFGEVWRDLISLKAYSWGCVLLFNTKDAFWAINETFTSFQFGSKICLTIIFWLIIFSRWTVLSIFHHFRLINVEKVLPQVIVLVENRGWCALGLKHLIFKVILALKDISAWVLSFQLRVRSGQKAPLPLFLYLRPPLLLFLTPTTFALFQGPIQLLCLPSNLCSHSSVYQPHWEIKKCAQWWHFWAFSPPAGRWFSNLSLCQHHLGGILNTNGPALSQNL